MKNRIDFFDNEVVKHFSVRDEFYAEAYAYGLVLPMLPMLYEFKEPHWLRMERIEGTPYLDTGINIPALALTIASFHAVTYLDGLCLCHIDNQPRNILHSPNGYYLIDFADSRMDYPERDITHLLLFWAADMPSTLFKSSCTSFLKHYTKLVALTNDKWKQCLEKSITAFDTRRSLYRKPGGKNAPEIQAENRLFLTQVHFTSYNRYIGNTLRCNTLPPAIHHSCIL
jgi:tRNA A-37 threonylcarbamoyl transferase component Bud32